MGTTRMVLAAIMVAVVTIQEARCAQKPGDYFKICRRNDSKLNECIKDTMHDMRAKLKKGIPALKMASIDPMRVSALSLKQGSGSLVLDAKYTNLIIQGVSEYKILEAKADLDNYRIDLKIAVPQLNIECGYQLSGRVLVLPIQGSGESSSNYTGVTGSATLIGHPVTRNGKQYMSLDEFKIALAVTGYKVHLTNLFNGNKELGDTMNRFLNENWKVMFGELQPAVDEAIGALFKNVAVRVFDKFPFDELFPK